MEQTTLPILSRKTTETLLEQRRKDPQAFYQHVLSLRANGWPLRAIAQSLGVSRTAVSAWEAKAIPHSSLPESEKLPETLNIQLNSTYRQTTLTPEQEAELLSLSQLASQVRRHTALQAPTRKAANELESLLLKYSNAGVSITKLANACKVTRRAIAQRLEKYK